MEIRRIALMGAGGIGAYFIKGLPEKFGEDFWVVADGERAERLRRDGLVIDGKKYFPLVKSAEESTDADLLIISVKYTALRNALPEIARIAAGGATVMSVLNGVTSEEVVAEQVEESQILWSVMKIVAARKGNEIVINPDWDFGVFYGDPKMKVSASRGEDSLRDSAVPEQMTERMQAVHEAFSGTTVKDHPTAEILKHMWYKYAINVSRNLPQAVLDVGAGAYMDSEHVRFIVKALRQEVVAVAAAKGIDISDPSQNGDELDDTGSPARFSTLQDLDAGRKTEIDMFSGAMMEMGKVLDVPVPYNEAMYHLIKALEEKNDGMFQYG